MVTATHTKTDKLLSDVLREMRQVRVLMEPISKALTMQKNKEKNLPSWLQASLLDEKMGRISGPFNTVKELMNDLNSPGK